MDSHNDDAHPSPLCPELPSQPLLERLVDAASSIPRSALPAGKGHLVLSVVFSPPRPTKMLYPWAHLDDPREIASGARPFPTHPTQTWEEMVFFHAEWRRDDEHEDDAKMILAVEGYHYTLPEHGSAVFYLSKLDTTGWGPRLNHPNVRRQLASFEAQGSSSPSSTLPTQHSEGIGVNISSLTGHLTEHFLAYFMSLRHMPRLAVECLPPTHISLHILARAQAAYLFPNSPDNPLKKPLSDAKLIVWWRQVLSRVVELMRRSEGKVDTSATRKRIDAFYMIPGMDKLESHPLVTLPHLTHDSVVKKVGWKYGHPYTATGGEGSSNDSDLPPLPLFPSSRVGEGERLTKCRSIANLMPRFEDDPQSRFLDELAGEGQEISAFGDLLRRSDSGRSTNTAVSNGTTAVAMSSSRSSSSSTSFTADSSETFIPNKPYLDDGSAAQKGDASSVYEPSNFPFTPSKKMRRTRSGAESPYNVSREPSSPQVSPTPTRASPRLREKERQRSPSKSAVKLSTTARLSPTKAQSPLRTSRLGSSSSAADIPYSPFNANGDSSSVQVSAPAAATTAETTMGGGSGGRMTQAHLAALRCRLALDSVSPKEFWMRMGFRQECSSGSLVGCFFLGVTTYTTTETPPLPIPPQPRPRFTIPIRELQRTMRNELQLDDCNWHLPRDSIELTQYFDEERGRLLAHTGRLFPEEKDEERLRLLRGVRRTRATAKGEMVVEGGEKMKKVSKKHAKRNNADENWIWRVGELIVWNSVPLVGFSETTVDQAMRKATLQLDKAQMVHGGKTTTEMLPTGETITKPAVTMLTVKRKRKT